MCSCRFPVSCKEAPGLSKGVEGLGRDVFLKLDENDTWQLYHATSIPKVFDRMTGKRWEWHGSRRVAVLHTVGAVWQWRNGRHYPAAATSRYHSAP